MTVHQQPSNGISEHFLYKYSNFFKRKKKGYDFDLIQLHLHVARIHIPALNYNKIITTGIQILSYIHAYTKSKKEKTLHLDIAATGELEKQSLLEHSEIFIFIFPLRNGRFNCQQIPHLCLRFSMRIFMFFLMITVEK